MGRARFRERGGGKAGGWAKQAAAGAAGGAGGAPLLPPRLPTSSCDVEGEREGARGRGRRRLRRGPGWRPLSREAGTAVGRPGRGCRDPGVPRRSAEQRDRAMRPSPGCRGRGEAGSDSDFSKEIRKWEGQCRPQVPPYLPDKGHVRRRRRRALLGLHVASVEKVTGRGVSLGIPQSGIPLVTFKEQPPPPTPFRRQALAT